MTASLGLKGRVGERKNTAGREIAGTKAQKCEAAWCLGQRYGGGERQRKGWQVIGLETQAPTR